MVDPPDEWGNSKLQVEYYQQQQRTTSAGASLESVERLLQSCRRLRCLAGSTFNNLTVQRCLRLFPPCAEGRLEYLRLRNAFDLPMDCLHLLDTDASAAEAAELPAIIEAIGAPKVSDPWL